MHSYLLFNALIAYACSTRSLRELQQLWMEALTVPTHAVTNSVTSLRGAYVAAFDLRSLQCRQLSRQTGCLDSQPWKYTTKKRELFLDSCLLLEAKHSSKGSKWLERGECRVTFCCEQTAHKRQLNNSHPATLNACLGSTTICTSTTCIYTCDKH